MAAQAIARNAQALAPGAGALVSAYQSMPTEPGTGALIADLRIRGDRILLPRIVGRDLEWVEVSTGAEFARGPLGILEPTGPGLPVRPHPLVDADVLFMPALAIDHAGHRLGQGGGYYDKALAGVHRFADGGPLRVALIFDDEFVDSVPSDDQDSSVDAVVTPTRTLRLQP